MVFSETEQHIFKTIDEIELGRYCRPRSQRFESINAVRFGQGAHEELFQMTVSNKHGIKLKGIQDVLSKEKEPERKVRFYFVVPDDIFSQFRTPQNYLTAQGIKHKTVPQWITNKVEQWVLQLNYHAF